MTETEAAELLEDMGDDDDDGQETAGGRIWYPQVIPVNLENNGRGRDCLAGGIYIVRWD